MQSYSFYIKPTSQAARFVATIRADFVGTASELFVLDHQEALANGGSGALVVIVEHAAVDREHPVVWVHRIDERHSTEYDLRSEGLS